MPKALYDLLSDKLGDSKITIGDQDEALVTELVAQYYDKAGAKDAVQKANEDLIKKRDTYRNQLDEYEGKVKTMQDELENYKKNALSDDEKKKYKEYKNKGMNEDAEARFNSLNEDLKNTQEQLKQMQSAIKEKEAKEKQTHVELEKQRLRTELISALNKNGITSRANIALHVIEGEGLAKLNENEGVYNRAFYYKKDGKTLSVDSIDDLVKNFANDNEYLVESSGNNGTGNNHSSNGNPGGFNYATADTTQLQQNAADTMLKYS